MIFPTTKQLRAALVVAALGFANTYAKTDISTYKEVKNEYLKTFAQDKQQEETTLYDAAQAEANKQTELKLVVEEMSDYDQHDLVANMFLQQGKLQNHAGVIDSTFIRKMELICGGENTQQHLLAHLLPETMSVFGHIGFASILINPTTNIAELQQRQQIIKGIQEIVATAPYGQELQNSFAKIKDAQVNTLRYWQPEAEMNQELFKRLYYHKYLNFLNKSTVALECGTQLTHFLASINLAAPLIVLTAANATTIYDNNEREVRWGNKNFKPMSLSEATWEGIKKIPGQIAFMRPFLKTFKNDSPRELGTKIQDKIDALDKPSYLDKEKYEAYNKERLAYEAQLEPQTVADFLYTQDPQTRALILGFGAFYTGMYIYSSKKTIDAVTLNNTLTNHLQERLISVATCITETKKIYKLLQSHPDTAQMPAVQQFATFFGKDATVSDKLSDLLGKLQTDTFKGEPSFFSVRGRILATHKLMEEVKNELIPLFEAVGQIEAYLAVAQLYNKHTEFPSKFCFAEYLESEKPVIVMENFWNPFIKPHVVVANNAVFNSAGIERNVILTGPNTAGKSTVVKGVGLNILLAQTFGICAADRAVLTPFSILNCHLNITDDIASGTSLFQAEVQRAKALLDDVRSLKPHHFCFTIMDEVFNGTNAEGGSEAAYKFSDQLGQHQNLIVVIATHFGKLTDLDSTGNFRNMHVGAHLDAAGKLVRPFKLEPGIFKDPENKILHAILEKEGIFSSEVQAYA